MIILVINSGSSSLKYTLFEMEDEQRVLFDGEVERIGMQGGRRIFRAEGRDRKIEDLDTSDQGEALDAVLKTLVEDGPLTSLDQVTAVTHRIGHGGKYRDAVIIDDDVMAEIRSMTRMLPLHHPAMIRGIEECSQRMPNAVHVAVFDTWFHWSIPDEAAIYGLPYRYFKEKGYRRTGFHGNSHAYVAAKAAEYLNWPIEELKIVSCHLGSGASLCAIKGGKSVDTTLGMTAVPGLIMGTRAGEVDCGLIPIIMKDEGLSSDETMEMLYRRSGLKGVSDVSSDFRDLERAAEKGNARAALALDAFCYQVKRSIGSMMIVMGGCDCLIFTGGIGRNSPTARTKALTDTHSMGFILDEAKNREARATSTKPVVEVSSPKSRVRILVIRTFEELMMARQCAKLLEG